MPAVNLHRVHGLGNTIFPRPSFRELAEDFSYDVDSIIGEHARPSETIPHLAQELLKSILKSSEDSVMPSCHRSWPPADSNRHLAGGEPPGTGSVPLL